MVRSSSPRFPGHSLETNHSTTPDSTVFSGTPLRLHALDKKYGRRSDSMSELRLRSGSKLKTDAVSL
jgi:hypothetical protein